MSHLNSKLRTLRTFAAALCATTAIVLLAGCSGEATGDFQEYADLDKSDAMDVAEPGAEAEPAAEPAENDDQAAAKDQADPQADQPADSGSDQPAAPSEVVTADAVRAPTNTDPPNDPEQVAAASFEAGRAAKKAIENLPVPAPLPKPQKAKSARPQRKVKVLVKERDFKVEGPEKAIRITYDDFDLLKVLNMEPVTPDAPDLMPGWLKELDGRRVRVRGFMYPPFEETGLTFFVLARDNQICCFGRNPKIYDLVEVTMRDGQTTDYIQNRPFDVVGVFRIRPEAADGKLYRLYEIEDAIVID